MVVFLIGLFCEFVIVLLIVVGFSDNWRFVIVVWLVVIIVFIVVCV